MKRHIASILVFLILTGLLGFHSISLARDKWTEKADMPTARDNLSTSVVNGKIYAIGGSIGLVGGVAVPTAAVEEYDPATDTWIKKTDMPTPRWGLSTSTVDGKIYAIGGKKFGNILSTVEEYDPVTDKWTKKADIPTARMWLSTSVVNGKIYAIGGWDGSSLATVEEYDPKTDKWMKKEKADMPTARSALSSSVVKGRIYAIGGRTEPPGIGFMSHSTVEEFNPLTNKWTRKADMPTARGHLSSSVINGKIYAIGGASVRMAYYPTVEEYDPEMDRWAKKSDMPTARNGLATSVVNERIYAVGGSNFQLGGSLSTVSEYSSRFSSLGVEAKGKLPTSWGGIKSRY